MGVRLSLMDWVQSLIVKFLEKIISVNTIRDIEENYLVPKNLMLLGVGVSVLDDGKSIILGWYVDEEKIKKGMDEIV